mmetsp:Transcript_29301/g.74275  ORF Transcript_29301/g.74275 Transcript_29301/m.74275 type:complete len:249 (+) Transcript_29301:179-925(+)
MSLRSCLPASPVTKRRPSLASTSRICSRCHSSSYLRFTSRPAVELFSALAVAMSALLLFSAARSCASLSTTMVLAICCTLTLRSSHAISMLLRISSASFMPSAVATSRLPCACAIFTSMVDLASISCTRAWPTISSMISLCSISYRVHCARRSCFLRELVRTTCSSSWLASSCSTRMVFSCRLATSEIFVRLVVVSSRDLARLRGSRVSVTLTFLICTPKGRNLFESDASMLCANSSRRSLTRSWVTE